MCDCNGFMPNKINYCMSTNERLCFVMFGVLSRFTSLLSLNVKTGGRYALAVRFKPATPLLKPDK
jgi:hypothetical protein